MQIVATQKNIRQTPLKLRLVANQVKGLGLENALKQLALIEKKSTIVILKTLRQAIANANNNHRLEFADLELKDILVMEGPRYKRWKAASRGRAHSIIKRNSHVRVILESKKEEIRNQKEDKKQASKPAVQQSPAGENSSEKTKIEKSDVKASVKKTEIKKKVVSPKASSKKALGTSVRRTTHKG